MSKLLTREQFKAAVFSRHAGRCVLCHKPAVDAHHIMDRKLFSDGGYYLENGAPVCNDCHWKCETTAVTVETVLSACGLRGPLLPDGFDTTLIYDKWGNAVLPSGARRPGPLFHDDGVQKVLGKAQLLHLFHISS